MRVKNRKTIWNLSLKSFRASGKRNLIAVVAIVLTTVLFTSLFTIVMSLNESYQTYTFRQIGGYAHGTFKDVTDKQAEEIKEHKKVKAAGERIVAGIIAEGAFARVPAEVSYMDENNTKWSYIDLKEGREPEGTKEIILDDAALELLGVTPELGAEVTLTYQVSDKKAERGSADGHLHPCGMVGVRSCHAGALHQYLQSLYGTAGAGHDRGGPGALPEGLKCHAVLQPGY